MSESELLLVLWVAGSAAYVARQHPTIGQPLLVGLGVAAVLVPLLSSS